MILSFLQRYKYYFTVQYIYFILLSFQGSSVREEGCAGTEVISRQICGEHEWAALLDLPRITSAGNMQNTFS